MRSNEGEPVEKVFRAAQDALFDMFRWATDGQDDGTLKDTAERVLRSQEHAVRMMHAMTGAWTELANGDFGGPDGIRSFFEKLQKDGSPMGGAWSDAEKLEQVAEQWRTNGERFAESWQRFASLDTETWPESLRSALPFEFLSSPGLGPTRGYQAKMGKMFAAWLDYQRRDLDYRSLLGKAWMDAFAATLQEMTRWAQDNGAPPAARDMVELWINIADDRFIRLFKTAEFSKTQAALMNALMHLKTQRRAVLDDVLVAHDLPTRREVDEAHRTIYALRKELKAVKKELANTAAADAAASQETARALNALREELRTVQMALKASAPVPEPSAPTKGSTDG